MGGGQRGGVITPSPTPPCHGAGRQAGCSWPAGPAGCSWQVGRQAVAGLPDLLAVAGRQAVAGLPDDTGGRGGGR